MPRLVDAASTGAPNLVVVMYSSTERRGERVLRRRGVGTRCSTAWEHAVDEMGGAVPHRRLLGRAWWPGWTPCSRIPRPTYEPPYTPTIVRQARSRTAAIPAIMWLFVIALVGVAVARVAQVPEDRGVVERRR